MSSFYPDLSFRYRHPGRTTGQQPQNLARPTWKGMDGMRSMNGLACAACDRASAAEIGMRGLKGLGSLGEAYDEGRVPLGVWISYSLLSVAGGVGGAYHGYKRNGNSGGWAAWWFLMGAWFPLITVPVALVQGFGERKR